MQYREFPFAFEQKAADEEEDGYISGYGSAFGGPPDLQGDIMVHGCFRDTIAENSGWPILFGHSMSKCCGFWTKAVEDKRGLFLEGQLTLDSPEGASAAALVRHGSRLKLPFGLSIGYSVNPQGYKVDGDVRKLTSVTLHEVSLVPVPACGRARVARVKSGAMTVTDIEDTLRDAGFSRNEAKRIIADCKALRDAVPDDEEEAKALREAWAAELRERSAKARGALLVNSFREVRTSWLQER